MALRSVSAPCTKTFHQKKAIAYSRTVWKRETVSSKARQRLVRMRRCAFSIQARKNIRRANRKFRKQHRERKAVTSSSSGWAIPAYIVMCESGGDYQAQNPSGAYGAYQLMPTWWSHLGRKPTPREQDAIAAKLWNGGAGASNWVCA